MLKLPPGIQPDTVRLGSPDKTIKSTNVSRCLRACIDNKQYMSWQMAKENKTCRLFYQVPPHAWHPGLISGQKSSSTVHDSMRTLDRSGNYPQSGNTTIATGGKRVSPSFMVSNCFEQICKQFEEHGCLVSTSKTFAKAFHGALAVNVTVEPGKKRTLTLVLGWFYPNGGFTGILYALKIIAPHYV